MILNDGMKTSTYLFNLLSNNSFGMGQNIIFATNSTYGSVVYWSESQVRFPALPDFLRSSASGTGSTQPREYN
jgi:hypothetical protein